MDDSQHLISVTPSDALTFHLEKGTSPRVVFTVTNTSPFKLAFKVKTTQPAWYFVKPNQSVLGEGQSEEIAVALADNECDRILDRVEETGEVESLDKHRFLIMSRPIEEEQFGAIATLGKASNNSSTSGTDAAIASQRQAELVKIWQTPDPTTSSSTSADGKRNKKLKVMYVYPNRTTTRVSKNSSSSTTNSSINSADKNSKNSGGGPSSGSVKPPRSVSENLDILRNQIADGDEKPSSSSSRSAAASSDRQGAAATASAAISGSNTGASTGGWDVNDLAILKSKYDTIVEYTVHLTAERDMIATQLDVLKREYNNELQQGGSGASGGNSSTHRDKGSSSSGSGGKSGKGSPRGGPGASAAAGGGAGELGNARQLQIKANGFSFMVLVAAAVVAFFLGRYS